MAERVTKAFTPFKKGDLVWLDAKNIKFFQVPKKFALKRHGPLEIIEVLGPLTYRLKLPAQWKIHDVFHATLLSPYHETKEHGPNFSYPPPDEVEHEEQWEVEAIVGRKKHGRTYRYQVKWKGYPPSENSWEPESNLKNAAELLDTYKKEHP
ncbi:chromo domain-like protein, partial [Dichomitus squalens LYAD-421 SS1]